MAKPVYKHPSFVIKTSEKRIISENKRLWLSLTIDESSDESIIVILKNPSRATKDISDKTVYNVSSYIFKNKHKYIQLNNIGNIIILNLIPFYETYSHLLSVSGINIIDKDNLATIKKFTAKCNNIIIAWGDHPKGLKNEYEEIKKNIINILEYNKNNIFYVAKLSKNKNPKHGQVWGYEDKLLQYFF